MIMARFDITRRLESASPAVFSLYCITAAFGVYFCMYAFRKPFTAGTFEGVMLFGIGYKAVLIVSQVFGYTLSKFVGIKVVSEMPANRRAWGILILIGTAHLSLVLFGMVRAPYNFVFLFLNGLPLGLVFGLVLGFLEGRRLTELLTAGLCASFIISSGAVKSIGRLLILKYNVSEYWMPALTGLIFAPLLLLSVWLLAQIPLPSREDVQSRSPREPIRKVARARVFRRHALGLSLLVIIYTLITFLRSLRDDFAVEIWAGLGETKKPEIYAISELLVMFAVVFVNGAAFLIHNNRRAFLAALGAIAAGLCTILIATFAFLQEWIGGFSFMVVIGVGIYVPYVAFHTTLFERMIAVFRDVANLGYLMYLADAFGYLGYVVILLIGNCGSQHIRFLPLLINCCIIISVVSIIMIAWTTWYYILKLQKSIGSSQEPIHLELVSKRLAILTRKVLK